MLALKRLVTILVMVFVLLALLVLLVPSVRSSFASMAGSYESLYFGLLVTAVVLLALQLITENLDSTLLRRNISLHEGKINELKARLYDQQMELREREFQQRPGTVPGTTTYPDPTPEPSRPVFPQSDPSLSNAPIDQPNSIIPPNKPGSPQPPLR
ncbi:hypothetical protein FY528_16325 [Hymenobacter lutimineralis]|uniref:Uncharacterized protein n=1 Tax=Hymenobacter lutimineralis TaxID=2606448 RepID=A0A5D6UUA1_9BACT|nr:MULTISPECIES: hypothetical protein [Hymenobacter]QIX62102.1 hypothetical protein HER32_13260 [Hymenobacter sp. BT18]TYZ07073.1 hypothetical protein FY528_16325 [Hymenobacter lutimineralis]